MEMKNRNDLSKPSARLNRKRGTPEDIRSDQHQSVEQLKVGHIWSGAAPAGQVATADGYGGASWQPNAAAGVFAYTPYNSLYGPNNVAQPLANNAIQIGNTASAGGDSGVSIGHNSIAANAFSVAVGYDAETKPGFPSVAIGAFSESNTRGVAVGRQAIAGPNRIAIGYDAESAGPGYTYGGIAIGQYSYSFSPTGGAIAIGYKADANDGIAIGYGAISALPGVFPIYPSIAIGKNAFANSSAYGGAIAIGASAEALGGVGGSGQGIAIGVSAYASHGAIALGYTANADGNDALAIGRAADAGLNGIAIGPSTSVGISNGLALGQNAQATGTFGVGIGINARANFPGALAVGANAISGYPYGIAIGPSANVAAGGTYAMAIGYGATVSATNSTALGYRVSNSVASSVRLGVGSTSFIHFDDFTPVAAATTPGHYFIVEFNAGRYKIPLEAIP